MGSRTGHTIYPFLLGTSLAAAVSMQACFSASDNDDETISDGGTAGTGGTGVECADDADCAAEETCSANRCVSDGAGGNQGTSGGGGAGGESAANGGAETGGTGAGGAAGNDGAAGAPAGECGPVIDDLEDGDGHICAGNGRQGPWFAWANGGTIYPTGSLFDSTLLNPARGSSEYGMNLTGAGVTEAGIGVEFNRPGDPAAEPYDASAYTGVKFYAKADAAYGFRVALHTKSTEQTTSGGICLLAGDCKANEKAGLTFSTVWQEFSIPFADLAGGIAVFDASEVMSIHIATSGSASGDLDIWIDDLTFY